MVSLSALCRSVHAALLGAALAIAPLFLQCALLPSPAHAVEVTQLLDAPPSHSLTGGDPYRYAPWEYPPPEWTSGKMLPLNEWQHTSRRPHAFGPRPLQPPPGYYPGSHAVSTSHGRIIPVSQYTIPPYSTGPDPAAMPMLNGAKQSKRSSKPENAPGTTTRSSTVTGRGVTPPTVARAATPTRPSMAQPTQPSVAKPATPSTPTTSAPGAVQNPYSATPASPTGPITPASPTSPTTNSPSIAGRTQGQGGVMDAGTPATQVPDGNTTVQPTAQPGTAGAAGNAGSVTGALRTAPNEIPRQRPPVLSGPAESLVIPPAGISLTPNNGAGALTSPPVTQ